MDSLSGMKSLIMNESKNVASFVVIGETLDKLYYKDKLVKNQKEFLTWTKQNLGFSKSTTYEYIISYRVYSDIIKNLPPSYSPPQYQSHCQLLSKIPSEDLPQLWKDVHDSCNGSITTAILENYLEEHNIKEKKPSSSRRTSQTPAKRPSKRRKKYDSSSEEEEDITLESDDSEVKMPTSSRASIRRQETPEPLQPTSLELEHTPPKKRSMMRQNTAVKPSRPFDTGYVFEVAQRVIGGDFDKICHSAAEFQSLQQETWYGRLYCDLSACRPYSSTTSPGQEDYGIEKVLQVIFTRYANKEYNEGIFIIRAEFGADWFTPILQHPNCILRQTIGHESFDSYVAFYIGPNVADFCHHFRNVGYLSGFNCWSFSQGSSHQSPSSARSLNMLRMEEADYIDTQEFLNQEKDDESGHSRQSQTLSQSQSHDEHDENENENVGGNERKSGNQEDMSIASVLCGLTG